MLFRTGAALAAVSQHETKGSDMASEKLTVTNQQRDTILFPPVTPPNGGKPFVLSLGSQDDDTEDARADGVLQPAQAVPSWAVEALRKLPVFRHLEASHHVTVTRPA